MQSQCCTFCGKTWINAWQKTKKIGCVLHYFCCCACVEKLFCFSKWQNRFPIVRAKVFSHTTAQVSLWFTHLCFDEPQNITLMIIQPHDTRSFNFKKFSVLQDMWCVFQHFVKCSLIQDKKKWYVKCEHLKTVNPSFRVPPVENALGVYPEISDSLTFPLTDGWFCSPP